MDRQMDEYNPPTEFGRWLKTQMAARDMGVRKAAQYIGIHPSMLSSYLLGQTHPSPKTARKIARFFNVEAEVVLAMLPGLSESIDTAAAAAAESELIRQIDRDRYISPKAREWLKRIVAAEYEEWKRSHRT